MKKTSILLAILFITIAVFIGYFKYKNQKVRSELLFNELMTKNQNLTINGVWKLVEISSNQLEVRDVVRFTIDGKRFHFYAGCNDFNGRINFKEKSDVIFSLSGATSMYCSNNNEDDILDIILSARMLETKQSELLLYDENKNRLMSFLKIRKDNVLEQKEWIVGSLNLYDGPTMIREIDQPKQTLVFKDGKVVGHAGCNQYYGEYKIEKDILYVSDITTTWKTCQGKKGLYESRFLRLLDQPLKIDFEGEGLCLRDQSGACKISIH